MKRTLITILLVVSLPIMLQAMTSFPDDEWGPPSIGPLKEKMKLTPEQEKEFDKLHFEFAKQRIDLHGKIATARLELMNLLKSDNPEQAAAEKKVTEISSYQTKMKIAGLTLWFGINKILNPEQQKLWKEHIRRNIAGM